MDVVRRASCGGGATEFGVGLLRIGLDFGGCVFCCFGCTCNKCCSSGLFFAEIDSTESSPFVVDFRRGVEDDFVGDFKANWYPLIMVSYDMLRGSLSTYSASPVINGLISARLIA